MTRPRRRAGFGSSLLLGLVVSFGAPSAWAQSGQADAQQKAAAEALFDEGRQLLTQGQYEDACRRFEQSQEIDPAVGILLYLGDCYERIGKLASAWAIFREANSRASAAGQADRARVADERARKLSVILSKLVLVVPREDRAPGFELLLDGRVISSGLFGVPFPVDAGPHEITARAPGRQAWSSTIEVKPNADYRSVQIPVLAVSATEPAALAANTPATQPGVRSEPVVPPPQAPAPDRTAAYVIGGAGVVAIGVGVGFGLRASNKEEQAKDVCPSNCISEEGAELNEQARTSALIANISYGVGAAALLTSAYMLFVAGSESESESAARGAPGLALGAGIGPGEGRVSLSGSF